MEEALYWGAVRRMFLDIGWQSKRSHNKHHLRWNSVHVCYQCQKQDQGDIEKNGIVNNILLIEHKFIIELTRGQLMRQFKKPLQ